MCCLWLSCDQRHFSASSPSYQVDLPDGFPAFEVPEDNVLTADRVELGRKLFYDPLLSRDSSMSCGSCHLLSSGMADNLPISTGVKGRVGKRNVPTLANIAYHPYFFREGGSPTIEMQALGPLQEHSEMDMTIAEIIERLRNVPTYVEWAEKAYNQEMNAFVLTRALGAFQRTILTGNSKYDQFKKDSTLFDDNEMAGMQLFFSERLQCATCHTGFDFTDYRIVNNGLYSEYKDKGLTRVTHQETDIGKFKVPSLRNIAVSHPYMHDGSLPDLESVIEHYNKGGRSHPNQSPLIKPLDLTDQEKAQLLAFLLTLTDESFLNNKQLSPPTAQTN